MADRERKRAERQKRKRRSSERGEEPGGESGPAVELSENGDGSISRSELKNIEAREALVPLAEDERPGVVTVGAILTALAATLSVLGYALWDPLESLHEGDAKPPIGGVFVFVILFGTMAWGMWKVRYWAVLGFQTVLVFVILLSSFALIQATTILEAIGNVAIVAASGFLFFKMVKALARIQMPDRQPRP